MKIDIYGNSVYTMYKQTMSDTLCDYSYVNKSKGGRTMIAQVKTWGNSQGIRLPKDLLEEMGIRLNDFLSVDVQGENIVLTKTFKHKTLEERAAEFAGSVGPYEEFEWGDPVGREQW